MTRATSRTRLTPQARDRAVRRMTVATGLVSVTAVAATGVAAAAAARETEQHEAAKQAQRTAPPAAAPSAPKVRTHVLAAPTTSRESATASARASSRSRSTRTATAHPAATDPAASTTTAKPRTSTATHTPTATAPAAARPAQAASLEAAQACAHHQAAGARAGAAPPHAHPHARPVDRLVSTTTDRAADTADTGTCAYAAAQWSALGTYAQLVVAGPAALDAARAEADRLLSAVDMAYSRFRPDSDLVRVNRAAGSWVRVHPLLVAALTAALAAADETGGLVDPTLGGALEALGYDRDFSELPRPDEPPGPDAGRVPVPPRSQVPPRSPIQCGLPPGARWRWTRPARSACPRASCSTSARWARHSPPTSSPVRSPERSASTAS